MLKLEHQTFDLEEHDFRMLADAAVEYTSYTLDASGFVTSWNMSAARLQGFRAEDAIGEHFTRFYLDESLGTGFIQSALESAAIEGRFDFKAWCVRGNGSRFWSRTIIYPIRNISHEILGFSIVTQDITAQQNTQDALRNSERQFSIFVQGVTDYAIFMLDMSGYIISWNKGAQKIKGYEENEIIGQHLSRFYTVADRERRQPDIALDTAMRVGRFENEGWRVRKDGSQFWAHVVIDAIYDDNGKLAGFAKITRDVTDRLERQRLQDRTREILAQAQKMDALGRLTGGIAHDFNNYLAVIIGNLNIVHSKIGSGCQNIQSNILDALEGADRASQLTRRLLSFSRAQPLTMASLDANQVLSDVVRVLRPSLGESYELTMRLDGNLDRFRSDENQLQSALFNLVINARDAMPDGGTIEITTSKMRVSDAFVSALGNVPIGDYTVLSVKDHGCGMTPETLFMAFDPFFTTKAVGKGTGLGLSQVYGFMQQCGGQVRIESEVDKGTTVFLYFPRDPDVSAGIEASDNDRKQKVPIGRSDEIILVVEDEDLVRRIAVESLRELEYTVVHAASSKKALEIIESSACIDLLFTDIVMPQLSGVELADILRRNRPGLKVLFMTGYPRDAFERASDVEDVDIISKPFTLPQLATTVRRVLDR